jgi:sugar (pentulose or hexulose) kinase
VTILALDCGSSSVKAGVLRGGRIAGSVIRAAHPTRYGGVRAEVEAESILNAVSLACGKLATRSVDLIALSVMSPSWLAMDKRGRALTPIVTHQDRRSIDEAIRIERRIGMLRHLKLAGNRPFPGGISATTCAWFLRNEPGLMRRADLVGHLNTFLHRRLTNSRVTDPSNASFMGLYDTIGLAGWRDELCEAVGIRMHLLPQILWADEIGGMLTREGASLTGLRQGTPMLVGITDTSAAMLLAGANVGQVINVSGTTDVLAVCTDRPRPHRRLLTRALGAGRMWMSVSTLAAAGATLNWVHEQMFGEMSASQFKRMAERSIKRRRQAIPHFEPYLAGDRASMEQRTASFEGLTLATTREDMLLSVIDALAQASAQRLELLASHNPIPLRRQVMISGGVSDHLGRILHRDWKGRWTFRHEVDATLRGLWHLAAS